MLQPAIKGAGVECGRRPLIAGRFLGIVPAPPGWAFSMSSAPSSPITRRPWPCRIPRKSKGQTISQPFSNPTGSVPRSRGVRGAARGLERELKGLGATQEESHSLSARERQT